MINSFLRTLLLAGALALIAASSAGAQGTAYAPSPPSRGALYVDGQNDRYLLGGAWLFRPDRADIGLSQSWGGDVAGTDGWSVLSVPNSFNAGDLSNASMAGYVGWYRRDFTVPSDAFASYVAAADRHWIVRFESVNYRASVWLNGRLIGTHDGAYLPFELDLKGLRPGVNRLIVRVDNRRGPADLPPGPGGGWWNYGGILREVYLRAAQGVDLSQLQVRAIPTCQTCSAIMTEQATLRNLSNHQQTVRLHGMYGSVPIDFGTLSLGAGSTLGAEAVITIRHPRRWSPDHPNLYRATLKLADARDRRIGGWVTDSGIRAIAVTPGGRLLLNGRLLNLRGVNIHEQDALLGGVLTPARTNQVVGWMQTLGATLIRAHYPLSPELQELADRTGILVWSEVPVYQVRSQYLNQRSWLMRAYAQLQTDILVNQNHPSVLLWSIGNELTTPPDPPEAAYIAGATALAHKLDPTRPVGMAVSSWPGVACQSAYAPLDVIGFNDYFGWFDAGGGTTDDRDALGPFLDFFRTCYPTKPLFVSEFGFEGNRPGPVEERGTYSFQSDALAYHLAVFASKPWLSGAIYFAVQDFAARPGWGGGNPVPNPPFVQKGMVDVQGDLKPAYAVMSAIYHATIQIARAPARDPGRRTPPRGRRAPPGV